VNANSWPQPGLAPFRTLIALLILAAIGVSCTDPKLRTAFEVLDQVRLPAAYDKVAQLDDGITALRAYVGPTALARPKHVVPPRGYVPVQAPASTSHFWTNRGWSLIGRWRGPSPKKDIVCILSLRRATDVRRTHLELSSNDAAAIARGTMSAIHLSATCDFRAAKHRPTE
jgi:hypothetical protein